MVLEHTDECDYKKCAKTCNCGAKLTTSQALKLQDLLRLQQTQIQHYETEIDSAKYLTTLEDELREASSRVWNAQNSAHSFRNIAHNAIRLLDDIVLAANISKHPRTKACDMPSSYPGHCVYCDQLRELDAIKQGLKSAQGSRNEDEDEDEDY